MFAAATTFNYFVSWRRDASEEASNLDAVAVWHLISLSFVLASCAEEKQI